jgi:hypothetical protein
MPRVRLDAPDARVIATANGIGELMDSVLVHIGYHKAASTWLQREFFTDQTGYRWLKKRPRRHPVRRLVLDRPLAFDAVGIRSAFDPLLEDAARAGVVPVVSFERLSGHPFSGGFDVDLIAGRILEVFPEARVLIVVREQRAIIASTYKQYVQAGGACSLGAFLDPPRSRGARVPWFDWRYFEYHHLVEGYNRLFGRERVLTVPVELLVRDGRGFVERIAEFGGHVVSDDVLGRLRYGRRSNKARSAPTIAVVRRLNRFGKRTEVNPSLIVESRLAARLSSWLQRTEVLDNWLTRRVATRSTSRLDSFVEQWAGDRYAESNRRLTELIDLDLAALGWMVPPSNAPD